MNMDNVIRVESKGAIVNQLNILTSELIIYSFNCASEECNVISINLLLLSVLFHSANLENKLSTKDGVILQNTQE